MDKGVRNSFLCNTVTDKLCCVFGGVCHKTFLYVSNVFEGGALCTVVPGILRVFIFFTERERKKYF